MGEYEVVTATTQESGEIVATRPSPAISAVPGLFLSQVHPDGSETTIRLDTPQAQAVLRSTIVLGSWTNRSTGISQGRAGNIARALMATVRTMTEKETPCST